MWVAGIFGEDFSAVSFGGGLYRGGTLQHWYFTALGIFSSKEFFFGIKTFCIVTSVEILLIPISKGYQKSNEIAWYCFRYTYADD